jgi:hypothetical protein
VTDDVTTGLPPLPGDQYWRVARAQHRPLDLRPLTVNFVVQVVAPAKPATIVRNAGARWWQSPYYTIPAVEATVVMKQDIEGDLTAAKIREAAETLLDRQVRLRKLAWEREQERLREETLLGDYPPKRLED